MKTLPLLGDRYRLGPIIGTGGMGAVHRAYDERFGREVAVKVVRSGADAVEQERLRREAQYLAGLDHPNLVAVYDAGADHTRTGETVWFAMELMHGPDLRAVIREHGRIAPADVARVLGGSAGALEVLHAAGVVHRDLKPANVLLTTAFGSTGWEVKIADLGIAHLIRAEHLTATGQVVGTAAYLSPEQVSGGRIGPPSDVYALGLLAIEALTGRVPFPGGPAESAMARLVRSPDVPAGAGSEWAALLGEMTAREPGDRPTASEVAHRLALLPTRADPIADPDATAVLTASALTPAEDVPTAALAFVRTQVIDLPPLPAVAEWSPSLRRRRPVLRGRRAVLAAGALAVAVGLAAGGAAVVGGAPGSDQVAAATVPTSSTPAGTPAPSRTPIAKPVGRAGPTPTRHAVTTAAHTTSSPAAPVKADRRSAEQARRAAERRARADLHRLRDRLAHELQHHPGDR